MFSSAVCIVDCNSVLGAALVVYESRLHAQTTCRCARDYVVSIVDVVVVGGGGGRHVGCGGVRRRVCVRA